MIKLTLLITLCGDFFTTGEKQTENMKMYEVPANLPPLQYLIKTNVVKSGIEI
jgi:hypothetical protein